MEASGAPYAALNSEHSETLGTSIMPDRVEVSSYLPNSTVPKSPEEVPVLPTYITIYVTILNIAIFVVGIVGNVLVILVVSRVRDMRTSINLYLANLSVADLLVLLVCQPSAMIEFYAKERWYLGPILCKLVPVLEHSVVHASTLTILVISWERYHAICRPLKEFLLCNKPRPLPVVLCIWGVALLTSLPFLAMTILKDSTFYDGRPCQVCRTTFNLPWHYVYILSIFGVFFLLPFLLLFGMYGNIVRHLYRRMHGGQAELSRLGSECCSGSSCEDDTMKARRQVIRMLLAVVGLFFLSLAPIRGFIVWKMFSPPESLDHLGMEAYYNLLWISLMLMYINSAGNPIIYSLMSSNFRKAFTLLLQGRINSARPSTGQTGSLRRVSVSVALKRMSLPAIGVYAQNTDGSRSLVRNNRGSRDSTCFGYLPHTKYSITSAQ
ncbi:hypothetical protein RRG08_062578 [Elysia crispata]|uniref:G-protein coupled receptors family 1 profile domain-containing protein n=1 Tax=Elysia crispata TaxID=231223 RepID=A0AAE1AML3_9GAST|nr:hypothetical protein RRG08_062578 [Elysia crispata]